MKAKTAKKVATRYLKGCKCAGTSTGWFRSGGKNIPIGIAMLLGLDAILRCDKCGKTWRQVEPRKGKGKVRAKVRRSIAPTEGE